MNTDSLPALWRVQWVHTSGYHASYQMIEAKSRKLAVIAVKDINCTLRRFKCWSWKIERLPYQRNKHGKWVLDLENPNPIPNESIRKSNSFNF